MQARIDEVAAAVVAILIWSAVAILAIAEKDIPESMSIGGTAALTYLFGSRGTVTIRRRLNGNGGP